ncbi:MAG: hypothetical protein CVU41_17560 [Chloroflexi bacterium HGW-Chloroflexi-3]|nr:MAG: hypothetical protein CVU41_17560 [Chloroflexi bacterium HGW-Chloroflexi-3]
MKRRILCLIIFTLFLEACGEARTTSPSPGNTSLPSSLPTNKPSPSLTTISPTKPLTITPRPTLNSLDIARTVLTDLSIEVTHEYSPTGYCDWKRIIGWSTDFKYNNQFFTYATITCVNQDKPWVLVESWAEQGLGYPLTSLLGWSTDEKYAYFYDKIIPDGCQPRGSFGRGLYQVDLNTGTIKSYPVDQTRGISLSPDASMIVFYDHQMSEVIIYNLLDQYEKHIAFDIPSGMDNWGAGDFTWSPDGQKIIFIIDYGDACFVSGVSLRLIDTQTSKVTTLLERENQTLSVVEWSESNKILLSIDNEQQILDLTTGNVSKP